MHWAAACNCDADVVQLLLSKGADVRAVDKLQETPLHLAVCNPFSSDAKVVQILLDNGADVNAVDKLQETPLHKAASGTQGDAVKILLENGADVNAIEKHQRTPLHMAAEQNEKAEVYFIVMPVWTECVMSHNGETLCYQKGHAAPH